MEEPRGP